MTPKEKAQQLISLYESKDSGNGKMLAIKDCDNTLIAFQAIAICQRKNHNTYNSIFEKGGTAVMFFEDVKTELDSL